MVNAHTYPLEQGSPNYRPPSCCGTTCPMRPCKTLTLTDLIGHDGNCSPWTIGDPCIIHRQWQVLFMDSCPHTDISCLLWPVYWRSSGSPDSIVVRDWLRGTSSCITGGRLINDGSLISIVIRLQGGKCEESVKKFVAWICFFFCP